MIDLETASALEELMGLDDPSYRSVLYKYEGWNGDLRNIIWNTTGVLSQNQVANKCGPGRYLLRVKPPQQNGWLSATIRVDPDYVRDTPAASAAEQAAAVDLSPFAAIREAVSLLGELSAILERNRPAPQTLPEQMTGLMGQVMGMTTNVMQQAVQTNARMVTESQREINKLRQSFAEQLEAAQEEQYEDEEPLAGGGMVEGENAVVLTEEEERAATESELSSAAIEIIGPHLEKHLAVLIGEGPSGILAGYIRSTDYYKQLVKSPGALGRVKEWAVGQFGMDQAVQVFNTLKI
jgi:hypothetical protein